MNTTAAVEFIRNDMGDYAAQTPRGEYYLTRTGGEWVVELEGLYWDTFKSRVEAQEVIAELVATFAAEDAAAAAERTAAEPAAAVAPQLAPMVWEFFDTGEAYDASQCNDSIEDGAVLVAEDDQVVGILIQAWPTAVTTAYGAFHGYLTAEEFAGLDDARTEPIYAASYAVAVAVAEKRGWAVAVESFAVDAEPEIEQPRIPCATLTAADLGTAPELMPAYDGGLFGLALPEETTSVVAEPEPLALF
jgi:hypothetical protein